MDSRYNHQQYEDAIYQKWLTSGAFNPDTKPGQKPFTIVMPPPNANDPLHVGHAMFVSLEDILIRYHRMIGDDTLWIPGTDHAGIETQFVFEKKLKKDGQSRFQFDRETLYQMIWDYVQSNSDTAVNQLKKMGASADWSRFRFTLDPEIVRFVLSTFDKLDQAKLIYRDTRLVNYCPKCGTAFSDLEVVHKEMVDPLYYLNYGPFTIATVRIETMFRDQALAVHPDDNRYQKYLGQTLSIPNVLGPLTMKVVADDEVDPEFGTGIMKVSPAHDPHDYDLGKRHDLPVEPVIDFTGKLDLSWYFESHSQPTNPEEEKWLARAKRYHGLKVAAARVEIAKDLEEDGLIKKIDLKYTHNVGTCYRCGSALEPLPMPQFFIRVKPLVEPVLAGLANQEFTIMGAGHDKILKHWLENLKDWNISRQIVWGIRLPVWYDTTAFPDLGVTFLDGNKQLQRGPIGEFLSQGHTLKSIKAGLQSLRAPLSAQYVVSPTPPGENFIQETDTFDTWFSSGQWPVATLASLEAKTGKQELKRFYPTSVMETGYDILPFWVMRMLMFGYFLTGQAPFQTVYLHGLVRDQKGQKMSKSKGNVVNPLTAIDSYGADALRMALVIRSSAGLDKSVGEADFKAMRNFTNKMWNAARFVQTKLADRNLTFSNSSSQAATDQAGPYSALYQHLGQVVTAVTQQLNDFKIGLAADTLYTEFWHWFCDEAIENAKSISEPADQQAYAAFLGTGVVTFLKLLHPFAPFVTEAIWQELQIDPTELLISQAWPR